MYIYTSLHTLGPKLGILNLLEAPGLVEAYTESRRYWAPVVLLCQGVLKSKGELLSSSSSFISDVCCFWMFGVGLEAAVRL